VLKKTIAYEDYNGNDVAEDFYFNFTKLEIIEMLELDDLEGTIQKLTETENAKEAYHLFKKIILSALGTKSEDGKRFIKNAETVEAFEQSPACSELILEFLENPSLGASFIEGTLPAKLVAEAKAAQAKNPSSEEVSEMVKEAARREDQPQELRVVNEPSTTKKYSDYSHSELLSMSKEKFDALVGTDPQKMSQEQLVIAMRRKTQ
jgi:hypothetical protein